MKGRTAIDGTWVLSRSAAALASARLVCGAGGAVDDSSHETARTGNETRPIAATANSEVRAVRRGFGVTPCSTSAQPTTRSPCNGAYSPAASATQSEGPASGAAAALRSFATCSWSGSWPVAGGGRAAIEGPSGMEGDSPAGTTFAASSSAPCNEGRCSAAIAVGGGVVIVNFADEAKAAFMQGANQVLIAAAVAECAP